MAGTHDILIQIVLVCYGELVRLLDHAARQLPPFENIVSIDPRLVLSEFYSLFAFPDVKEVICITIFPILNSANKIVLVMG